MKTYVFTNRVYPPVAGATGELLKELAEGLAAAGARVLVVTSRGSRNETAGRETINGVEVIRVGTLRFTRASHWLRALSYAGLYPQFAWQVWKQGAVDAVVSMTDPPLQLAVVTLASFRAKKKIHWAQDLYPELAEELRVIPRNSLVARILRAVSKWALAKQDKIVVLGRCMRERLVGRGIDEQKIEVIPNWTSVSEASHTESASVRERLGWSGKFIALYSGNLGLAHDFETLVGAARRLGSGGIELVFAGEGPRLDEVRRLTAGLPCVSFLPPQPKQNLSAFLAAADVHLVTMRAELEGLVVPSKAYGAMASRKPLIYVGPASSEIARAIDETGAGTAVRNGDAEALVSALRKEFASKSDSQASGGAGRLSLAMPLSRWCDILK